MADYAGTSLTIGPHPLALRRQELAMRGVLRAIDLPRGRHGRRVRVAGAVITRQRPGTAKGFVFLTLEDETGIANIIVRPDLFTEQRRTIVGAPYLVVEGVLQIQEGVTSVKAERVISLTHAGPDPRIPRFPLGWLSCGPVLATLLRAKHGGGAVVKVAERGAGAPPFKRREEWTACDSS